MPALYQTLAESLMQDIHSGRLQPGERLPSVRRFSRQREVSLTTALQCYRQLEAEGFVQARPQSGFYVRHKEKLPAGPELPVFTGRAARVANIGAIEEVQAVSSRRDFAPFGVSLLAPSLVPSDMLQRSLIRASRRLGERLFHYGPAQGDVGLREALARHFKDDGMAFSPDDLMICNGGMDAVSLGLQLCTQPGETVAVLTPCFSGLLQVIESLGRKVLEIPLHYRGIYPERLRAAMARPDVKACLLSANNHNPLGFTLSAQEKKDIAAWAAAHQCPVIEDDIFGECGYGRQRPLPIKSWDDEGWVFWCGSVSKTLTPAYRLGWCAPGKWRQAALQHRRALTISINLPLQAALADFMHCGEYRSHLRKLRLSLAQQVDAMSRAILQSFPAGSTVTEPEGGYVLWVTLPPQCDGWRVFQRAAQEGLSISPGTVFSITERYRHCIRLNAGWPFDEKAQTAVRRLGEICREAVR
ncbi:PLP-dependent aminotransferase family protein [Hahella sp. NBU794]|uniref:aminotransferase-like domain-containing protein n=1 Tax=Hahella sp. NBU794 TaxID=3422590 RepID=UPI003D6E918E